MKFNNMLGHGVKVLALVTAGVALASTASAQTIHDRKENQQDRIGQGVTSGQLTPRETAHLERREARVNRETRNMRARDNGKLTARDRKIVNAQQNRISRNIYRDKHNARRL